MAATTSAPFSVNKQLGLPNFTFGSGMMGGGAPIASPVLLPTCAISVSPLSIAFGSSTTLTWTSSNATSATISTTTSMVVGTSGSLTVSPFDTTTYTLTAANTTSSANCSTSATVARPANDGSPLGMNLAGIAYWSSEQPFLDNMKMLGSWLTGIQNVTWDTAEQQYIPIDANGWPTAVTVPGRSFTYVHMFMFFAPGRYSVLYDGEGTINYYFDAVKNVALSTPGRDVIDVAAKVSGLDIALFATDPNHTGNYIRNIRIVQTRFESLLNSGEIFNPDFIDRVKPFRLFRFMDWMWTNFSTNSAWSDLPSPNYAFWGQPVSGTRSVPISVMVSLLNKTHTDAWFNMPERATDDYVTKFATYVHNNLGIKQDVYLEYSNETWNGLFSAPTYMQTQGATLWPTANVWAAGRSYYGMRTSQICENWKAVWGADSARVHCVIGTQTGNYGVNTATLSCPQWSQAPCGSNHGIEKLAITGYFGISTMVPATLASWIAQADGGLTSLFADIDSSLAGWGTIAQTEKSMASIYGVNKIVAYEGGASLVDSLASTTVEGLFVKAQRDPRMTTVYANYLNQWATKGGDLFNQFDDIGSYGYNTYGNWGALEEVASTTSSEYAGLKNFIDANPCWWSGCTQASYADTYKPYVAMTSPATGGGVHGSVVTLSASAYDNVSVSRVQFSVDSTVVGNSANTSSPYSIVWNSNSVASGVHTISAVAFDAAGNSSTSIVSVTVDNTAPGVAITVPATGAFISGASVTLTATSTDNVGVTGVQFSVDGVNTGSSGITSPYSIAWSSTGVADGSHTIAVAAHDSSNNYATSSVSVIVENNAPVISSVSSGTPIVTGTTITWNTNTGASSQVAYGTTISYTASSTIDNTLLTSHSVILSGLASGTAYHFQILSTDGIGHIATSTDRMFATASSTLATETNSWINAVAFAGGTVSSARQTVVNTLISCLKTNGLFSTMDRDWLFAAENTQQASVDILHLATTTPHGTSTFTVDHGYKGDGTTGYFDTGFVPSTAGGNYAQNSASFGVYILADRTVVDFPGGSIGADPGDDSSTILFQPFALNTYAVPQAMFAINSPGHGGGSAYPLTATTTRAFWEVTRTSSTAVAFYMNGSLNSTNSIASAPLVGNMSVLISAAMAYGGVSGYGKDQIGEAFIGSGLTATQSANWSSCHNAYMTSLGVNVY